jgi:hypothetical protein
MNNFKSKGEFCHFFIFLTNRIIDWDFTVASPLQNLATWPKLLQYTPGLVPPGHSDEFMSHPADQETFIQLLRGKERRRYGSETIANLVETSYERNFFELSLQMKTVHQQWIKAHPPTQSEAALGQLLLVESKMKRYHQQVEHVRSELLKRLKGQG